MSKVYVKLLLGLFAMGISVLSFAQVSVTASAGTPGPTAYTTLKGAIDAINAGTHMGTITVTISANVTETVNSQLSPSGSGTASYTGITIKPAASSNPVVTAALANGILWIFGSNVTIDGSNNGTTSRNLTFNNTDTTGGRLGPISVLNTTTTANTNITVKNCIIKSGYYPLLFSGIGSTGLSAGYFSNITIQNNQISRGDFGVVLLGGSGSITGANVTGNDINGTGTDANFSIGVYALGLTNSNITGNKIGNFEATEESDDEGIYLGSGSTNVTIDKNMISNIGHTAGLGYGGRGIEVNSASSGSNVKIVNNMIANIYGDGDNYQTTAALDNPTGIMLSGTQTGVTVAYNTVYMSGNTLNKTGAMSRGLYAAANSFFSLQNNIFVNNLGVSSATGATGFGSVAVYLAGAASQLTSANFNDYYVGATGTGSNYIGLIGTNGTIATLALWQSMTGQESNSKNVLPVFVSATDLHLVPASNLALDNAGTPIAGITVDIDNDTRSTSTPDIGADEFVGSATDINAPTITYTALGIACATTDRTLTVTITDATGVPTTGALMPRIYYKKASQSTYQSAAGTLSSGGATNGTWTFTISSSALGGVAAGDQIQYYIIAQDNVTTPNIGSSPAGVVASNVNTVTTAPTTLNSYTVGSPLSGTVTVGTGGTYTTLTAAANAYNSGCLSGALTFSLTAATYGTGETFPITFSNVNGNGTNTLTIKPATGISPTITGTSTTAMIWINGADYITIDGSNTAGGSTRDLTVTSTAPGLVPVIWITSNGSANGATNNTIKNVKIVGAAAATTAAGILTGGPTTVGSNAEAPNSNNTISNNAISKVQNGVYIQGGASTAYDVNWNVSNNLIGATSSANDTLSNRGIFIGQSQNFLINGNTIRGVRSVATQTITTGITVGGASNGGTISNNKISNIHQNNTAGWGSNGIALSSSNTTANITVHNNMINDVTGYGYNDYTVADNGYGIVINNGAGYNLYYNTVNMDSSQTLATGNSAALNIDNTVTATGAVRLVDNLLINNQTGGSTARYSIINRSTAGAAVFAAINYNDYYTSGANLGYSGSTAVSNLAALTTALGGNANSFSVKPNFVSATDMHLTSANNSAINNHGTPVSGITTDIDGTTRSTTVPDPGADEFDSPTAVVSVNDPDVVSMSLLPNIVNDRTTVRVVTRKAMSMQWNVVDATGKVVMTISRKLNAGRNDVEVEVSRLAAGYYQVVGLTETGKAGAVNMIKQ